MTFGEFTTRYFPDGRQIGKEYVALCPAHPDKHPSLSIAEGQDRTILLQCRSHNCTPESICFAVGIEVSELFPNKNGADPTPWIEKAVYDYTDEQGEPLFQVVRKERTGADGRRQKNFPQRRPDGQGGWIPNLNGVRRVPYRLHELVASKDPFVLVTEGEKDADTARGLGFTATCNPGGAGKWRDEFSEYLRGKIVCVTAHADEPGRKHGQQVAASVADKAAGLKVIEGPASKDLTEFVERGGTREALLEFIGNAPEWKPTQELPRKPVLRFRTGVDLANEPAVEMKVIAEPLFISGAVTELVGQAKAAGKTTLVLDAVTAILERRPWLGKVTRYTPVMYLSEQGDASLLPALKRAKLLDRPDFVLLTRPQTMGLAWTVVIDETLAECMRRGCGVLVIDTLGPFIGLRGDDENKSGAALEALVPLQAAAAQGLAVLIVRHERKSGGEVGESGRGSTAFTGFVDTVIRLHRPPGNHAPTVREMEILSRFTALPPTLEAELLPDGYVSRGTRAAMKTNEAADVLLKNAYTDKANAKAIAELKGSVTERTAKRAADELVKAGRLRWVWGFRNGKKVKTYYRVVSQHPDDVSPNT